LWITGLPGSGKTILCASVIEKARAQRGERSIILFFFCDHRDPAKLSHENFVMSLTRQLVESSPELLKHAKSIYDEKANNGDRPFNSSEYVALIESCLDCFEEVSVLCDALDEATEGEAIASTLARLSAYGVEREIPVRILSTSRFDVQLERRHEQITKHRITLTENMKPDIKQYVDTDVEVRMTKGSLKLRDKTLSSLIKEQVALRAGT
jgi:amino acid transporter